MSTTISFISENQFTVEGHAMYGEYGQDIVCSAISSMLYLTMRGLENNDEIRVNTGDGFIDVEIKFPFNNFSKAFLYAFYQSLKELEILYPNHVKIEGVPY